MATAVQFAFLLVMRRERPFLSFGKRKAMLPGDAERSSARTMANADSKQAEEPEKKQTPHCNIFRVIWDTCRARRLAYTSFVRGDYLPVHLCAQCGDFIYALARSHYGTLKTQDRSTQRSSDFIFNVHTLFGSAFDIPVIFKLIIMTAPAQGASRTKP